MKEAVQVELITLGGTIVLSIAVGLTTARVILAGVLSLMIRPPL
jgi:hypothetical protein